MQLTPKSFYGTTRTSSRKQVCNELIRRMTASTVPQAGSSTHSLINSLSLSLSLSLSRSLPNHDSPEAFENAKHDSKTQSYKTPNAKPKDENKTKTGTKLIRVQLTYKIEYRRSSACEATKAQNSRLQVLSSCLLSLSLYD